MFELRSAMLDFSLMIVQEQGNEATSNPPLELGQSTEWALGFFIRLLHFDSDPFHPSLMIVMLLPSVGR